MDNIKEETNILLINDNEADVKIIRQFLNQTMRAPWKLTHCLNVREAIPLANEVNIIILDLALKGPEAPRKLFKSVKHLSFETPIIVLSGKKRRRLATHIMEKGAADIIIRGRFERLVDAIEFALIRQQIATKKRINSDQALQKEHDDAVRKLMNANNMRKKEQEESKQALSMLMGGYSVANGGQEENT
jgi:DNA-binding NtrC family response regulator